MCFDCKALPLMDFLLKRSKAGGLPQLSSQQECNQSPNSTAPNTTNCRLHQEINNLSVTEKWHLTAKGRLARSALRNLSFRSLCCTCSVDNESTSGSRTVTLTSLTGSESCGSEGIVCVWTFLGGFFLGNTYGYNWLSSPSTLSLPVIQLSATQR